MATGGASLRRLLLAAILLSLAIHLQEVTADSGGQVSEGGGGNKTGGVEGEVHQPVEDGENGKSSTDSEVGGRDKTDGDKVDEDSKDEESTTNEDEISVDNEQTNNNNLRIPEGNETESGNSTILKPACPEECAEWKLEVLALCGTELKGFDNLCYFYQHKCKNPAAGCHFYCCLYPGTDIATASKFDCDEICRF